MATKPTTKPEPIDLDAARAARAAAREAGAEGPTVIVDGETFPLPVEPPLLFLELIYEDRIREAFQHLNADLAAKLDGFSFPDVAELADGVADRYGLGGGLGNLRASGRSSSNTSNR